jgi:hypothetical protein
MRPQDAAIALVFRQGRQRKTVKLSGVQFVRRWMQHVLPPAFVRVRYYGLLANAARTARLARCRELLAASGTVASPPSSASLEPAADRAPACPRCQVGRLRLISRDDRPSWWEVLERSPYTTRGLRPRRKQGASVPRVADLEDTS